MDIQKLVLTQKLMVKPIPPTNKYRLWCYEQVNKTYFEYFITSCILLNTIVMAINYYLMP